MNLYAKVTSERATKGQGGEYLDIEILNEQKEVFATVKVRGQVLTIWHSGDTVVNSYKDNSMNSKPKGYNSNKDTLLCVKSGCGRIQSENSEYCYCHFEELDKKGKRRKGDRLGECHCGYPCLYGTDYCERHQLP